MKFLSPTINMFFEAKDFIKFCSQLKYYLSLDLNEERNDKYEFPVAKLGDIRIYGVHYENFKDLKNKWNKRKKRVNFENIYIVMEERDGCTYNDIIKFDNLPYKHKVIFVHKNMPEIKSAYYINGTEAIGEKNNKVRPLTDYKGKFTGKRFLDDFDWVKFLNEKG